MTIRNHPQRRQVVSEMHLRRIPPLHAPGTLWQIVRTVEPEERQTEAKHLARAGAQAAGQDPRQIIWERDGVQFAWERHTEGTTATIFVCDSVDPAKSAEALAWLEALPGLAMRATRVRIVDSEPAATALIMEAGFARAMTVCCRIGSATIWSDFNLPDDQDYGRMVVWANCTDPHELARTMQQVQELGNYRNMALLGLPLTQEKGFKLRDIENALTDLGGHICDASSDRHALDQLVELAAQASALRADTEYRLSATAAYGQIVAERLASLNAEPVEEYIPLAAFTERRLLPALRTCTSFRQRLERVTHGIENAVSMVRTRVDLVMQDQNAEVLSSMERSATRQVKLQHLVEEISVVALTYYAIGLLEKALAGTRISEIVGWPPEAIAAMAIIPALVFLVLLRKWRTEHALK